MQQHETTEQKQARIPNFSGIGPQQFGGNRWKFISALIRKQIGKCRIVKTAIYTRADTEADNYIELTVERGVLPKSGYIRIDTHCKLSTVDRYEQFKQVCRLLSKNNIRYQWDFSVGSSITVWAKSFGDDDEHYFGAGSNDGLTYHYMNKDRTGGLASLLVSRGD